MNNNNNDTSEYLEHEWNPNINDGFNLDESESSVMMLTQNDSTATLLDNQQQEQQSDHHVPSSLPVVTKKDEELILLAPEEQQSAQNKQQQCDDNQNNMNNNNNNNSRMLMMQNFNVGASRERILVNLKQLLALYARLKRQLMEFTEVKTNEQSSYKEKCDEMSSQVMYTN